MAESKMVVHIRPARAGSGSDVERYQNTAKRWHDRGAEIADVPDDGRHHLVDIGPCPVCSRGYSRDQLIHDLAICVRAASQGPTGPVAHQAVKRLLGNIQTAPVHAIEARLREVL